jgi:hypothetical protein
MFERQDTQTKFRRNLGRNSILAAALALQSPTFVAPAFAQDAHQGRVTADQVYRQTPGNPLHLHRLGENPVVRNGDLLSLNEVHATREQLAPTMEDWAENDMENALRLINGYRAGERATSDAALVSRVEALVAATPRLGGMTQEVDVTDLLTASGYQVGTGVRVSIEAVSGGESQTYRAGTQADGADGVKLIPLGTHDGLLVEGDGNGANESIRINVRRTVNRHGQLVTETVAADVADHCGNAFLLPYMEVTAPAAQEAVNPCPTRSRVMVEGLPRNSVVTVVYNVDMTHANIPTVSGEACPAASLPEICPDCTRVVASRLTGEVSAHMGRRLGILSAQTLEVSGTSLDVELPGTVPVTVGGRIVNIDLQRAIRDGSIVISLSCPRDKNEDLSRRLGHLDTNDHNVTIETQDWAWAGNNHDADGEVDLPLRYTGSEYVRGRLHSSN